eukprot:1151347-Pelagomonas_calceolata.AAC.2
MPVLRPATAPLATPCPLPLDRSRPRPSAAACCSWSPAIVAQRPHAAAPATHHQHHPVPGPDPRRVVNHFLEGALHARASLEAEQALRLASSCSWTQPHLTLGPLHQQQQRSHARLARDFDCSRAHAVVLPAQVLRAQDRRLLPADRALLLAAAAAAAAGTR